MLTITVPGNELYDESRNEFVPVKGATLQLEHSLLSLSKWESKWCKPFLGKSPKTLEEIVDYVKCMTINSGVDQNVYKCLSRDNLSSIQKYIDSPMTATTINDRNSRKSNEIITSELIYYWMIVSNIPFECQKWHLNRLLTLIRVCSIKNAPAEKMTRAELSDRNTQLNKMRRAELGSKG